MSASPPAKTSFETSACQPLEKTLKIRNNDASQPQRVQGVLFELGTNDYDKNGLQPDHLKAGEVYTHFYKIEDVTVNSTVKKAVAGEVDEVQLPPGAVMSIRVVYNPQP